MLVAGREPNRKTEFSATRRLGDRGAHRKMAAQLDGASRQELAGKLQRLARYLEGMWQPEIAQKYEKAALELERGVTPQRLYQICKTVLATVTGHHDGLLVIYVQKSDGSPDSRETEKYNVLLKEVQAFARRTVIVARFHWAARGFRW